MKRILSLAAACALATAASARGQQEKPQPGDAPRQQQPDAARPATNQRQALRPANAAAKTISDSVFAAAATAGGQAEVSLSQLGAQKATDEQLKQFSQKMIQEHTKANQELGNLAQEKRLQVPQQQADARAQFCLQSLSGLQGEEFDRCYAKAQLILHQEALAMYEAAADRAEDADVRAWAQKMVPHIQQHLDTIKPIAQRYMDEGREANIGDRPARNALETGQTRPRVPAAQPPREAGTPGTDTPRAVTPSPGTPPNR